MKAFWRVLKRFAAPYKKYLGGSLILNLLSAVFNIFSFALLIPILNILFKMDQTVYEFMPWDGMPTKEQLMNNFYYGVSSMIDKWGGSTALLLLGLIFAGMTVLKTSCYFASSAVMIPWILFWTPINLSINSGLTPSLSSSSGIATTETGFSLSSWQIHVGTQETESIRFFSDSRLCPSMILRLTDNADNFRRHGSKCCP